MKASMLAHAAPAILLTALLAGGVSTTGLAQTAANQMTPGQTPAGQTAPTATAPVTSPSSSNAPSSTTSSSTMSSATSGGAVTKPSATAPARTQRSAAKAAPGGSMKQLVERRITDLHSRLHITAQQQPQWTQFAQVMRDNATQIDQAYQQRAEKLSSMNAVENMQSYAAIEQTRTQDVQKLVPAFQTLYASLSDTQKKDADQMFRSYAETAQKRQAATR